MYFLFPTLQTYLHGFTRLSSATNGDLMAMVVNVGLENHENCVLMLDQKPNTTEMTQIDGRVVVECSGQLCLQMLNHGLRVSKSVIAGMQMEMVVNVEEEPQLHSVPPLENSLKNIGMTQIVDLVGVGCHGNCLSLAIHPVG